MVPKINQYQWVPWVLIGIVVVGVVLDGLNRWLSECFVLREESNFSVFFRAGLLLVSSLIAFGTSNWFRWMSIAFVAVALAGAATLSGEMDLNWMLKIKFALKFLFPVSLFFGVAYLALRYAQWKQLFFSILFWVFVFQSVVVITGFVFDISFLRSYYGQRFGYAPLIASINECSLFFIIALSFVYYDVTKGGTRNAVLRYVGASIVLIAAVVLGTKAVYLFLILLAIYHLTTLKKFHWIPIVMLGGIVLAGVLLVAPFFVNLYHQFGLWEAVSSFRFQLIQERVIPLISEHWMWYNYFIGGNDTWTHFVEMDLIDLFSFSGIIGLTLVIAMWFKSIFNFGRSNHFGLFFAFSILLISNMSGHFLWSGVNAVYLAMFSIIMQDEKELLGINFQI